MEQEGQQAHGHDRIDLLGARVGRHKEGIARQQQQHGAQGDHGARALSQQDIDARDVDEQPQNAQRIVGHQHQGRHAHRKAHGLQHPGCRLQALLVATQPVPQRQRDSHVERGRHKARGRRRLLHPQQRPQKETHRPDHGQDQHDQELVLEFEVFLALLKLDGTKNELLERRHGVNPRARGGAGRVCKRMLAPVAFSSRKCYKKDSCLRTI